MSRAYKRRLMDEAADLGATGVSTVANAEKLSGADLEQVRLTAINGDSAAVSAAGGKTLGTNAAFAGTRNSAACTGADQERFAGEQ